VTYFDVQAEDDTSAGISTHGASEDVKVIQSTAKDCGGGVILRGKKNYLSHVTVLGSKTTTQSAESYSHGISLGDNNADFGQGLAGTDLDIHDCHVDIGNARWQSDGEDSYGLFSTVYLSNARITNSTFKGFSSHGIYSKGDGGADVRILDNVVDCSSQVGTSGVTGSYGIVLAPADTTSGNLYTRVRVRGNTVKSALFSAIRIHGNSDSAARANDIEVSGNDLSYGLRGVDLISGYFGTLTRVERNRFPSSNATIANSVVWTDANFTEWPVIQGSHIAVLPDGGHLVAGGRTPVIFFASFTAGGTGRSGSVSSGNDTAGIVNFTTGTGVGTGNLFGLTFGTAFSTNAAKIFFFPRNDASRQIHLFQGTTTTTQIVLVCNDTLTQSTTYSWNFLLAQ